MVVTVRVEIDIPGDLLRRLRELTAYQEATLESLVVRAIENEVARGRSPVRRRRRFPLVTSKQRGSLNLTTARHSTPALWTDAYLQAFAHQSGAPVVSFDRDFERFGEPAALILKP